jgi:hypothetical protein
MDIADSLDDLERILTEYRGMKYILDHYPLQSSDDWRLLLRDYLALPAFVSPVLQQVDDMRGRLRSDPAETEIGFLLKKLLWGHTTAYDTPQSALLP